MLLLVPGLGNAQAPSPEQALRVVAEYVEEQLATTSADWRLGFDTLRGGRLGPESPIDPAEHREILGRIAAERDLPFYPGEDFGRVLCDASPDPEHPGVNCRLSHGTRSMLTFVVVSSDDERGVTELRAMLGTVGETALRHDGGIRSGFANRTFNLEVVYDEAGSPRIRDDDSLLIFRNGYAEVDEIRSAPPGA